MELKGTFNTHIKKTAARFSASDILRIEPSMLPELNPKVVSNSPQHHMRGGRSSGCGGDGDSARFAPMNAFFWRGGTTGKGNFTYPHVIRPGTHAKEW